MLVKSRFGIDVCCISSISIDDKIEASTLHQRIDSMNSTSQTPPAPLPHNLTVRVAVGSSNPCKIEAVRKAFRDVFCASGNRKIQVLITSFDVPSGAKVYFPPLVCSLSRLSHHKGVSNQPYGDVETRQGAMNRANAAYNAACSCIDDRNIHPDFSVGLEGGLESQLYQQNIMTPEQSKEQNSNTTELWCMAWIAVLGSQSETCLAAKAEDDNYCSSSTDNNCRALVWGYAKTGSFLLPPKLSDLVLNKKMELGHADDLLFKRINSKYGQGTVGRLTDGQIDRDAYYVHALKLALIPWIRPQLYNRFVSSSTHADE